MSSKFKLDTPFLKRSNKLLPCQKEMLVWWKVNHGLSYNELSKMFNVSRQLAYFICNPEKLEKNRKTNSYKRKESNSDAVKKCRQHIKEIKTKFMKQTTITQDTGKTGVTDFKPERKSYTEPKVIDTFIDDTGEEVYVLENGNTVSKTRHDAIWKPSKGTVKAKGFKGEAISQPQKKV